MTSDFAADLRSRGISERLVDAAVERAAIVEYGDRRPRQSAEWIALRWAIAEQKKLAGILLTK